MILNLHYSYISDMHINTPYIYISSPCDVIVWSPQFTGTYKKACNPAIHKELDDVHKAHGWEVTRERADFGGKREFLIKRRMHGMDKEVPPLLRTWEVIGESYISSYNILANPEYAKAMKGFYET
jgi:hypothetical protein